MEHDGGYADVGAGMAAGAVAGEGAARVTVSLQTDGDTVRGVDYSS